MIERLELKNLTVFTGLTLDLSPKINVLIGETGTGKTHLLKAAYGLCAGAPLFKNKPGTSDDELEAALTAKLLRLFMPRPTRPICRPGSRGGRRLPRPSSTTRKRWQYRIAPTTSSTRPRRYSSRPRKSSRS
jgi:energy-coupling factor transporter ATP-binding protein EcfA2